MPRTVELEVVTVEELAESLTTRAPIVPSTSTELPAKSQYDHFTPAPMDPDLSRGVMEDIELTEDEKAERIAFYEWWSRLSYYGVQQGFLNLSEYDLYHNYYMGDYPYRRAYRAFTEEEQAVYNTRREEEQRAYEERRAYRERIYEAERQRMEQQADEANLRAGGTIIDPEALGNAIRNLSTSTAAAGQATFRWAATVNRAPLPAPVEYVAEQTFDPEPPQASVDFF